MVKAGEGGSPRGSSTLTLFKTEVNRQEEHSTDVLIPSVALGSKVNPPVLPHGVHIFEIESFS